MSNRDKPDDPVSLLVFAGVVVIASVVALVFVGHTFRERDEARAAVYAVRPRAPASAEVTASSAPASVFIVSEADLNGLPSKIYPHAPISVEKVIDRDGLRVTAEADRDGGLHVMCLVGPKEDPYLGEVWTRCSAGLCRWLVTAAELRESGADFGWCEWRPR